MKGFKISLITLGQFFEAISQIWENANPKIQEFDTLLQIYETEVDY